MDKAKGASGGRTLASCQRSARKAARAGGLPRAQQGDLGEAAFVYKATSLGFVVAKSYGNLHRYDSMVDGGNGLSRPGEDMRKLIRCARISPALAAGEIPAPERGRAAPPGIESWTHEGDDMS